MKIDYKYILDNAAEGVVVVDVASMKYVYVNKKMCEFSGYSEAELLQMGVLDMHPKKDLPYVKEQFKKHAEGKITLAKDMPLLKKDGSVLMCDVNAMTFSDGERRYNVGFFSDISERGKTEALLQNIIDSSADMIFVKDRELRSLLCNKAYAQAVGKEPQEMYGKTDIENGWLPELVKGDMSKGIKGFENDDKEALGGKVVHNPNDPANVGGETRIFDTMKLPLHDGQRNIIGVVGIARDITARKKLEDDLKTKMRDMERFYNATMDREKKVLELKEEIKRLKEELTKRP